VHLRPSGNAPEFRCYAESDSADAATVLVTRHLELLKARLG
jgi:phosphomannomutase